MIQCSDGLHFDDDRPLNQQIDMRLNEIVTDGNWS